MSRWEIHPRVTWGTGNTDRHFIVGIGTPVGSLALRQGNVTRSAKKKSTGPNVRGTGVASLGRPHIAQGWNLGSRPHLTAALEAIKKKLVRSGALYIGSVYRVLSNTDD